MLQTIGVMIFLLGIVSILTLFVTKKIKDRDFSELVARVKLWWGMVFVFSASTFVSPNVSILSLAFLCFFALKEFFSMKNTRKNDRRLFIWAYLSIPIQFYWIYIGWYGMFIIFIPIYIFLFLPLARASAGGTKGFLKSVSSTHWGLMLMVFGLSHLAFYPKLSDEYGSQLVLYLVLLTQLNDVLHYLVSKTFGKRQVAPSANPNLTTEGFVIAALTTIVASVLLAPELTPMSLVPSIFAGILISITGFLGALNIAYVKRDLLLDNEKSEPIPHKESFLSRIDSLSYTAPLFLHFIRYFFF